MRLVLTLLLAFAANPAWAEWLKASENDAVVFYVDPMSLRTVGAFRRVWELQDLRSRDLDGELSRRSFIEYDCVGQRYRVLSSSAHSGPMATGEVIANISDPDPDAWDHAPLKSVAETLLALVCRW
jgi:hypothetical protein